MKPAKPARGWALIEKGKINAGLIFSRRWATDEWCRKTGRRLVRVEIREVQPKRRKRR